MPRTIKDSPFADIHARHHSVTSSPEASEGVKHIVKNAGDRRLPEIRNAMDDLGIILLRADASDEAVRAFIEGVYGLIDKAIGVEAVGPSQPESVYPDPFPPNFSQQVDAKLYESRGE